MMDTREPGLSPDFAEPKGTSGVQWLHGRADASRKDNFLFDAKSADVEAQDAEKESPEDLGQAE